MYMKQHRCMSKEHNVASNLLYSGSSACLCPSFNVLAIKSTQHKLLSTVQCCDNQVRSGGKVYILLFFNMIYYIK